MQDLLKMPGGEKGRAGSPDPRTREVPEHDWRHLTSAGKGQSVERVGESASLRVGGEVSDAAGLPEMSASAGRASSRRAYRDTPQIWSLRLIRGVKPGLSRVWTIPWATSWFAAASSKLPPTRQMILGQASPRRRIRLF